MLPIAVNGDGRQMGIFARARCGCVQGLALDVPGDADIIRELKAWKRKGWALVRLPLDELPQLAAHCPHAKPRPPRAADPVLVRR